MDPAQVAVTVDAVLFAREHREVLLVQRAHDPFAGSWALPGGFIEPDETLEESVWRELGEETGLHRDRLECLGLGLQQMHTYGDPARDPRGRTVTVVFVGVMDAALEPAAASDAADARFWPVAELVGGGGGMSLAFDHDRILTDALAWWDRLGDQPG